MPELLAELIRFDTNINARIKSQNEQAACPKLIRHGIFGAGAAACVVSMTQSFPTITIAGVAAAAIAWRVHEGWQWASAARAEIENPRDGGEAYPAIISDLIAYRPITPPSAAEVEQIAVGLAEHFRTFIHERNVRQERDRSPGLLESATLYFAAASTSPHYVFSQLIGLLNRIDKNIYPRAIKILYGRNAPEPVQTTQDVLNRALSM